MAETCQTCRFWNKLEPGHTYADCRRLPPGKQFYVNARQPVRDRVEVTMQSYAAAEWPNTAHTDWCGEYQPAHRTGEKA